MPLSDLSLLDAQRLLFPHDFAAFCRWAWPLVSPDPLVWGRHLDALCLHLQGVAEGKTDNLLVNLPPRHSKSIVCTVLWPVWLWLRNPTERVISASYSKRLATEHSSQSRRLIESPDFKRLYPGLVLRDDSNAKDAYRNTEGGQRLAVSVGSSTTGFDATVLVIDDLHSVADRESEAEREAAVDYYRLTLSSRAVPGKRVPRVVVGQRVHAGDVSGYVLDTLDESWSCLVLPMEHRPDLPVLQNALGWKDWRKVEGEVLWPQAFPPARVAQIKRDHRHDYACLYGQDVDHTQGDLFRADWFRYWREQNGLLILNERPVRPSSCLRIAAVDLAVTTNSTSDWTVCVVADCQGGDVIVRHLLRKRLDGTRLVPELEAVYRAWKPAFVAVEKAGQQSVIIDQLKIKGLPVKGVVPQGDKETRSVTAQIKFEAGQVWYPANAEWLGAVQGELLAFPRGRHDDCVDALSLLTQMATKYDRSLPEVEVDTVEKQRLWREREYSRMLWGGIA